MPQPAPYPRTRNVPLFLSGILLAALACQSASACTLQVSNTETADALLSPLPEKQLDGYLDHLAKLSGCAFQNNPVPLARATQLFQQRQIQMMVGFIQTPERDKAGAFFPLIGLKAYWLSYSPPPATGDLSALLKQENIRVSIVRGAHFPSLLQGQLEQLRQNDQLDETDSEASAISMLRAKRDIAYVMTDVQYFSLRSKNALADLRGWPLKRVPPLQIGLYLNDETLAPAERQRLRAAIRQANAERYIAQLLAARIGYTSR